MQKLNTNYTHCQTTSALHLCVVNTQVLLQNFSKAFWFVLFIKESPTFTRHLRNRKKVFLTVTKENQNTTTGFQSNIHYHKYTMSYRIAISPW